MALSTAPTARRPAARWSHGAHHPGRGGRAHGDVPITAPSAVRTRRRLDDFHASSIGPSAPAARRPRSSGCRPPRRSWIRRTSSAGWSPVGSMWTGHLPMMPSSGAIPGRDPIRTGGPCPRTRRPADHRRQDGRSSTAWAHCAGCHVDHHTAPRWRMLGDPGEIAGSRPGASAVPLAHRSDIIDRSTSRMVALIAQGVAGWNLTKFRPEKHEKTVCEPARRSCRRRYPWRRWRASKV